MMGTKTDHGTHVWIVAVILQLIEGKFRGMVKISRTATGSITLLCEEPFTFPEC